MFELVNFYDFSLFSWSGRTWTWLTLVFGSLLLSSFSLLVLLTLLPNWKQFWWLLYLGLDFLDFYLLARLFSRGLTNFSNSISSMAEMTSEPAIVFLLWLVATVLAWEVAYSTNTLAAWQHDNRVINHFHCSPCMKRVLLTFVMATLASSETLQFFGRQSLISFDTIGVGRFRSSGLSAIVKPFFLHLALSSWSNFLFFMNLSVMCQKNSSDSKIFLFFSVYILCSWDLVCNLYLPALSQLVDCSSLFSNIQDDISPDHHWL